MWSHCYNDSTVLRRLYNNRVVKVQKVGGIYIWNGMCICINCTYFALIILSIILVSVLSYYGIFGPKQAVSKL